MVKAVMQQARYRVEASNGTMTLTADTEKEGRGGRAGFRPHELLEAALATCLNMTIRLSAERNGIRLEDVITSVELGRNVPDVAAFRYQILLPDGLTPKERETLLAAAQASPVKQTLSRSIRFESLAS